MTSDYQPTAYNALLDTTSNYEYR